MRRTIPTLTALVAAVGLTACSPETQEDTATGGTPVAGETAEDATSGDDATMTTGAADDAGTTTDAADDAGTTTDAGQAGASGDPVCETFFQGQGQPLAERADTTRDLLETGDPLDTVSYSELSLLQSRIDMLGQEASGEHADLLERVNAPFTEVVDAVVADDARLEAEIPVPDVDVTDSAAAQDELQAACGA